VRPIISHFFPVYNRDHSTKIHRLHVLHNFTASPGSIFKIFWRFQIFKYTRGRWNIILENYCYILIKLRIYLYISSMVFLNIFYLLHFIWKEFRDTLIFQPFHMFKKILILFCCIILYSKWPSTVKPPHQNSAYAYFLLSIPSASLVAVSVHLIILRTLELWTTHHQVSPCTSFSIRNLIRPLSGHVARDGDASDLQSWCTRFKSQPRRRIPDFFAVSFKQKTHTAS